MALRASSPAPDTQKDFSAGFIARRVCSIIPLLIFISCVAAQGQTVDSTVIALCISKAEKLYYQGRVDDAVKELKRGLKTNGNKAAIYVLLAKNYLRINDVHSRAEAEKAAKKAIDLEPENVENHVLLAKIFSERGFIENAQKFLEDIIRKYPDDKNALILLGSIYHKNAEKYRNLVSANQKQLMNYILIQNRYGTLTDVLEPWENRSEDYPILYFDKYFGEELGKARTTYEKLRSIDSTCEGLDRELAILAYKSKDWQGMAAAAERYLSDNPEDRDAFLFFGLALHRAGKFAKAEAMFAKYAGRLNPYERRLFNEFDFFLSETEQVAIAKMGPVAQEIYHDKFWLARDPLYLTEQNERKFEHYSRIAEANLLFGSRKEGIDGWKTDRGIIWIRYGEPARLNRNLNILAEHGSLRERFGKPRNYEGSEDLYEVWYYDGFSFMFYEFPLWSGNVKFYGGSDISFSEYARNVQSIIPDRYEFDSGGRQIAFPLYTVDFRGKGEKTRVELFYAIPAAALSHQKTDDGYHASGREGTFIFDRSWNWRYKGVDTLRHHSPEPIDSARGDVIIVRKQAELYPEEYHLAVEFTDDRSANYGRMSSLLAVEEYGYDSLEVSDILLAAHIEAVSDWDLFSIADLEFIPNVTRNFIRSRGIYLYFEIYNLTLSAGDPGRSRFRVEYAVRYRESEKENWKVSSVLGRLFNFSRNASLIALSTEYDGTRPVENLYIEIDPASLKKGMYRLTLGITDLLSGQKTEKDALFYLSGD